MKELENLYSYPKEWQNYGDVNPERHGGIFVKWDRDMWEIIETTHYADLPRSEYRLGNKVVSIGIAEKNEYMFSHMYIEPMDIWVNGNPYNGFTERMLKELNTFSNVSMMIGNKEDIPDNESYNDYVEWYLNNEWERLLPLIIHSLRGYVDSDPINFSSDYWGYLEKEGINKQDF